VLCWGSNEFNVLGIGVQYTFADQFPDPVVAVALASEPCPVVVKILSINCTSDACPQSSTVITITGDEFRTGGIAGATDMRFTLDGAFREDGSIILGAEVLATNLVEPSPVAGEWTLLNVVAEPGSYDVKGTWDVSDSTTYMTFRVAIDERCGFPASQGGSKPIAIDAAENTTCVATANGMAKCWGARAYKTSALRGSPLASFRPGTRMTRTSTPTTLSALSATSMAILFADATSRSRRRGGGLPWRRCKTTTRSWRRATTWPSRP